jgi:hypothetical protein
VTGKEGMKGWVGEGGSDEIYLPKTEMESVVETSFNRLLAVQVQLASIPTPVTVICMIRTPWSHQVWGWW